MPREGTLVWCDRCGIFLAPAGKKPRAGERAASVLTDTVMLCDRHAPAPAVEPEPVAIEQLRPAPAVEITAPEPEPEPEPLPEPDPVAPEPTGAERLAAAAEEAAGWSGRYGAIRGRLPATPPAPGAPDDKDTRMEERPVRRPAKPRPSTRVLTRGTTGPELIHRPTVAEKYGHPAPAPVNPADVARRRREAAEAYARSRGPGAPVSRRGIVSAAEILADVDAPVRGDVELVGIVAAAEYVGIAPRTLKGWMAYHYIPSEERRADGKRVLVYRASDLDALRDTVRAEQETARKAQAARAKEAEQRDEEARRAVLTSKGEPRKRLPTADRLDLIEQALDDGSTPKEAAAAAGYGYHANARAACLKAGRADLADRLRIRPTQTADAT